MVKDKIKRLEERFGRKKETYLELLQNNNRDKYKVNTKVVPRNERITEIEYIYVSFRNCNTARLVGEIFKKDVTFVKYVKQLVDICKAKKVSKNNRRSKSKSKKEE